MTNYERIKNMDTEELASKMVELRESLCKAYVFCAQCPFYCIRKYQFCKKSGFIDWLESEVEGG